jgi:tyrosine-protein kinase Etk/Wzc
MRDTSSGILVRDSESSATTVAQPAEEISLLDLLAAIGERKHIVVRTTAVMVAIGLALSFLLPKEYTATVTLLPPQQQSSLGSVLASQLGGLASVAGLAGGGASSLLKNPNDMYVAMFKSRTVEDAMVKKYGLMAEYHDKLLSITRKDFENHSKVDGSTKDGLLHISVTDRNPQRSAELANGYVDQFRHLSESLAITEAGQRRLFFEQQLEDAKNKLADAEEALKESELKSGVIQIDSQARALIESAASLRAQIAAQQVMIQGMRSYAADGNPNLVQAEQELDGLRAQLAKLAGNGGDSSDELIVPKGKVPEASLEYIRKYRDVRYYETIFEILAKQFELAKLDEAKEGALVQVVDPAIVPDRKSSPRRMLITAGSLVGGVFLGVFFALTAAGWENLNRDPVSSVQIESVKRAFRRKRAKKA